MHPAVAGGEVTSICQDPFHDAVPVHLVPITTNRGFKWLPKLSGINGDSVQVRESSNAEGPHLWLDVAQLTNLNDRKSPTFTATAHLPIETAEQLVDQLQHAIRNHYQNR